VRATFLRSGNWRLDWLRRTVNIISRLLAWPNMEVKLVQCEAWRQSNHDPAVTVIPLYAGTRLGVLGRRVAVQVVCSDLRQPWHVGEHIYVRNAMRTWLATRRIEGACGVNYKHIENIMEQSKPTWIPLYIEMHVSRATAIFEVENGCSSYSLQLARLMVLIYENEYIYFAVYDYKLRAGSL
jgi:hypothetical protein